MGGFWVTKESNASLGILKNGFTSMKVKCFFFLNFGKYSRVFIPGFSSFSYCSVGIL